MIVLHAGLHSDRLFVWGETPEPQEPKGRATRSYKTPQPSRYSLALGVEGLREAVSKLHAGVAPAKKDIEELAVWLPTKKNIPIPSPLIGEAPNPKAKPILAPWSMAAYGLNPTETVNLLCFCMGRQTLGSGVVVGSDLAYWSEAARFAGSIAARQQYLPDIVYENGRFFARWEPEFSAEDAEQITVLATNMPPVARALAHPDSDQPPEYPSIVLLKSFISAVVDFLARRPHPVRMQRTKGTKPASANSMHDAWIHALRSEEPLIDGDHSQLMHLWEQVREWRRPVAVAASSPYRLCFRLEEPADDVPVAGKRAAKNQDKWQVRYLLQSCTDPSLLIPSKDAWNVKSKTRAALGGNCVGLKEYLLFSLGQASSLCPRITQSLKASQPEGYHLDSEGAHDFLREKAPLLQQTGFTVMLPSWWTRTGSKARLSVRAIAKSPKLKSSSGLSLGDLVAFDWEVALGKDKVSLAELEALAKLKSGLVRVRGQWVEVSTEEIQAAIEFWKKQGSTETTVGDLVQMAVGIKEPAGGIQFKGVSATGWVGKLLQRLAKSSSVEPIPPMDCFNGTLRPYQARGLSWLSFLRQWGLGACLADDMGLGKTIQTLALIQRDWHGNARRPVLLVCPTTVVQNWQKEAARFTPDLPVYVHHGLARSKEASFKKEAKEYAIVVSSYGLLHRDVKFLKEVPWAGVILDEAQNIKNPDTKQAQAARCLKADYRIALTGTPVENNIGDLWSLMEFLNPGFLGKQSDFRRKFFVPIQAQHDVHATDRLKRITGPFILRRLKTDKSIISDLPDKLEMKVFCTLTKEQASLYKAVIKETEDALKSAEGIQRKGLVLATLSKLKQVCNHPTQFLGDNSALPGRSGKLARLTEMMEEILEVGDRALVFSQFAEMGKILQKYLQETFGQEVIFLHGGVSRAHRDRMVERFQADGKGPSIFLLSLKAGGTGLNLTAANHVFHFDRWWNPAVENQATDRAFRIGQTKNVQVHKFLCAGTLEEKIDDMIERKKDLAEKVVGTGEGWITELSNKDLQELWKLRKEAIGD